MSTPVKKGGYVSGYDEVVSGGTVISSGGYVFSVAQKQALEPAANVNGAAPATDLDSFIAGLDDDQKRACQEKIRVVDGEIAHGESADLEVVQETLKDVSRSWPQARAPLRAYIENNAAVIEPIRIVARRILAD
jgi:hypothetical protein